MPAVFTPFSGVNSRVSSAVVVPVPGVDLVTPLGTEVKTNMMEYTSFSVSRPRTSGQVLAAGSPVDAQGNIYPRQIRGGVVNPKISLEGIYNGDSGAGFSTDARFAIGGWVIMNLVFQAVGLWGYYNVLACVTDSGPSTKIGADPASIRIELLVDGLFPAPSTS